MRLTQIEFTSHFRYKIVRRVAMSLGTLMASNLLMLIIGLAGFVVFFVFTSIHILFVCSNMLLLSWHENSPYMLHQAK